LISRVPRVAAHEVAMTERDKTHTVHVSGPAEADKRDAANMDELSTQVLMDTSGQSVGLLTVTDGPGTGQTRSIFSGTNQVGRSTDNRVALNFGDTSISRLQHAVIAYDQTTRVFRIFDGGKQNPISINGKTLVGDQRLGDGDIVTIGLTTMRFNLA
jgi:hypothetical protein